MRVILSLVLFTFILTVPSASYAKGSVQVGDVIPHNLNLLDQKRKSRNFDDLKGKNGIVLVFVRSVDWCPFCQNQVIELNKNAKRFKDQGYPIVTISYDSVLSMNKFLTTHKPDITMLSDPRSKSIRAFGLLNEGPAKGTRTYGIAHPGVYIIGKDKKVQAKFFKESYKDRASITEILNKVKKLNPPAKPKRPYVPPMTIEEMGQDPIIPGQDIIDVPDEVLAPVLPSMIPDEALVNTPTAADLPVSTEDIPVLLDNKTAPINEAGIDSIP